LNINPNYVRIDELRSILKGVSFMQENTDNLTKWESAPCFQDHDDLYTEIVYDEQRDECIEQSLVTGFTQID